jgi:hypothetical protein
VPPYFTDTIIFRLPISLYLPQLTTLLEILQMINNIVVAAPQYQIDLVFEPITPNHSDVSSRLIQATYIAVYHQTNKHSTAYPQSMTLSGKHISFSLALAEVLVPKRQDYEYKRESNYKKGHVFKRGENATESSAESNNQADGFVDNPEFHCIVGMTSAQSLEDSKYLCILPVRRA